jgi:HNH endonuclease
VQVPGEDLQTEVHVWNDHKCWRCEYLGRVLMVFQGSSGIGHLEPSEPDERELGEAIRAFYPFFRPGYSNTMEMSYYANHCESCGALQGQHPVSDWALMESGRWDVPDSVQIIPNFVSHHEGYSYVDRRFLPFQIHHRNGDPSDRSLENLQILCPPCHRNKHAKGTSARDTSQPRR